MLHSSSSSSASELNNPIPDFDLKSMNSLFMIIREIRSLTKSKADLDYRGFLGNELKRQFGRNGIDCLRFSNKGEGVGIFKIINQMLEPSFRTQKCVIPLF